MPLQWMLRDDGGAPPDVFSHSVFDGQARFFLRAGGMTPLDVADEFLAERLRQAGGMPGRPLLLEVSDERGNVLGVYCGCPGESAKLLSPPQLSTDSVEKSVDKRIARHGAQASPETLKNVASDGLGVAVDGRGQSART